MGCLFIVQFAKAWPDSKVRMGVYSDYKPLGDYIRLHDGQLMIKIKDSGTDSLRRFIKERSDCDHRSLRDRHPGCQGTETNWYYKFFPYKFFKTVQYVNMSLIEDFISFYFILFFSTLYIDVCVRHLWWKFSEGPSACAISSVLWTLKNRIQ